MQLKFFTIPAMGDGNSVMEDELNAFLRGHRILNVQRELVNNGQMSCWCRCVEYIEGSKGTESPRTGGKEKIDYRNVLSEPDFEKFRRRNHFQSIDFFVKNRKISDFLSYLPKEPPIYGVITSRRFIMDEEKAIDHFDEQYAFLSNFYPCDILYKGVTFPALENAYQAAKYAGEDWVEVFLQFAQMTPGKAKRKGGKLALREDWDKIKLEVMEELLRIKFSDPYLRYLLIVTEEHELVEGNHWHDNFWGNCSCEKCDNKGLNHLGKLLMNLRSEYKNSETI